MEKGNERNLKYWIDFVDKLSGGQSLEHMVPEVLEDLCQTFDFGCGFVYRMGSDGLFRLAAGYRRHRDLCLAPELDLAGALGQDLMQALPRALSVCFRDDAPPETALELRMAELFGAGSMVAVAVVDEDGALMALVGLDDRRGHGRHAQEDMDFSRSVISTLANYIKMGIYQQRAQQAQRNLENTLDHMGIDVYVNDFATHEILYLNRSMAAPYGGQEAMTGEICWQVLYEGKTEACDFCPQKQLIDENGQPSKVYSWDYKRPFDGSWFRVFSAAAPWDNGRLAHIVSSVDITESKRNEEIIRQMAEYDHLTGLPNRYRLTQYIDERLERGGRQLTDAYILFFDLDGFKQVNDTMGHPAGDELLRQIGTALRENLLTRDNSYRYGGDEFVVLQDDSTPGSLEDTIGFLRGLFSRPWQLEEGAASVTASVGISHFPGDDTKTGDLVRKADQAMYVSKHSGRGLVHFYNRGDIQPMEAYFAKQ
ncbi:diguanylate cyclase [Ruminococcaceae bacterium OttesenSCG-928-D13]|nr:diguanylate cyclase [Ruminococcaceae bacterium OttesenSCG-928-D13]